MGPSGHGGNGPAALRKAGTWIAAAAVVAILLIIGRHHLPFILGVVIFVVALLTSVMLHELGHFLTAKKFGMRVTQFFVGFGRRCGRHSGARPSTASRRCRSAASSRSRA